MTMRRARTFLPSHHAGPHPHLPTPDDGSSGGTQGGGGAPAGGTDGADGSPDTGETDGGKGRDGDRSGWTAEQWQAEAEKWRAQSRKHEDRAKTNAKAADELDKLRQQHMSEAERAVDEARRAGRAEAFLELSGKVVAAEVRGLLAGRPVDADALLEGRDLSRFVDDKGEVDRTALAEWVDKVAPAQTGGTGQGNDGRRQGWPSTGQGRAQGDTSASGMAAGAAAYAARKDRPRTPITTT